MSTVATFHKTFFKNTPLFIFSRSFKHIYISLNFWHIWDFPFISVVDSSSALSSFPAVCLIASAVSISSIGVEATVCTISLCYILGDSSSQLFLHSSSFFYVQSEVCLFVVCLGSVLEDSLFSVFRGFWDSYSVQERKYGDQGDEGAPSCRENREVKRNREKKKKRHFKSEFWKKRVGEAISEEIKSEGELPWEPSA